MVLFYICAVRHSKLQNNGIGVIIIKKRIIALTLIAALVLTMALGISGCSKKTDNVTPPEDEQTQETQEPEVHAAPIDEPEEQPAEEQENQPEEQPAEEQENQPTEEPEDQPTVTVEKEQDTEETGVLNPDAQTEIDPDKPMVCLTFDDGPSEYTNEILDLLVEYNAKATFFEVGINTDGHEDAVRRELELGMQLGNHTWSHQDLGSISEEDALEEINKGKERLYEITGEYPTVLRPPYGSLNGKAYLVDVPIITWSVDTLDWESRDADAVMDAIFAEDTLDGKCILMHSLYGSTVEALRRLLPWLSENGFQCVTVSEMAEYRKGETLQPGQWYGYEYWR